MIATAAHAQTWSLNVVDIGYDPIGAGGEISYRVPISNPATTPTPASTIEFAIPANSVYKGVTGDLTGCSPTPPLTGPSTVICTVPAISAMSGIEAQLRLETITAGSVTLGATIDKGGPDETSAQQATAVVTSADLELTITGPAEIDAGEVYPLTLTVTNHGKNPSGTATASATLPPGLALPESLPTGCVLDGRTINCVLHDPLDVGQSKTFTINTQVTTDQDTNVSVAGYVTRGPNGPVDPNLTNNSAIKDFHVTPNTDVFLAKANDVTAVALVGDTITFTVEPKYAGLVPLEAQIIDSIPGNYAIVSVVTPPTSDWECEIDAQAVICGYENVSADAASYAGPITITATVLTPTQNLGDPAKPVFNTAMIYSPTDVITTNNEAKDDGVTIVAPRTDLDAEKSGPPHGLTVVGQSYDWKIWTRNSYPSSPDIGIVPFYGTIVFDDYIPAGLEIEAIATPAGWSCTPNSFPRTGPQKITCTSDNYTAANPLAVQASTPPITITTKVLAPGAINNELFVSSPNANAPDPFQANNHIITGINSGTGINVADVAVTKKVISTGPYLSGDTAVFEVEILNAGPGYSEDIVISDTLAKLYYENATTTGVILSTFAPPATTTGFTCAAPARAGDFKTTVSCNIDRLNACTAGVDCPRLTITASVGADGPQSNSVEAYSISTPDPDYDDNTATVGYTVNPRTEVELTKTAAPISGTDLFVAQRLTYSLTITVPKNGLSDANNVTLTEVLPKGLYYVSSTTDGGTCTSDSWPTPNTTATTEGQIVTCTWPTIANGGSKTVTFTFLPDDHLVPRPMANSASVSTTTPEIRYDNNSAATNHTVIAGSYDLLVNKISDPLSVAVGNDVTYEIIVENTGPAAVYSIVVEDLFPNRHLVYVSHDTTGSGFSCTASDIPAPPPPPSTLPASPGGKLTCTAPVIGVNMPASFKVTMRAMDRGVALNRVSVKSTELGTDREPDNNFNSITTPVYDVVDMKITKSSPNTLIEANYPFHWELFVKNDIPGNPDALAEAVVVRDTLPAGVTITGPVQAVSSTRPTIACNVAANARSFTCALGNMLHGENYTIDIPAIYNPSSSGTLPTSLTNTATVETKSFDKDLTSNSSSHNIPLPDGEIGGRVYVDFGKNDLFDTGQDLPVSGVSVTLVGKGGHGQDITLTTVTNSSGYYTFAGLADKKIAAPGNLLEYDVFYTVPTTPAGYVAHNALPNPSYNGQVDTIQRINAIRPKNGTGNNGPALNNDFTLFKAPTVRLEKTARQLGSLNGVHEFEFQISATNTSDEPLSAIQLYDLFDFPSVLTQRPSTATLQPGEYLIADVKKTGGGQSWVKDTSFTGALPTDRLGSLTRLPVGARTIVTINVKIFPPIPYPTAGITLSDDARVAAQGEYSGEAASATATAAVTMAPEAGISLVKGTTYTLPSPPNVARPGDPVPYTFVATNIGTVPLVDLELTDNYLTPSTLTYAGPLLPGQSHTFSATYSLTQADITKGRVDNTATVTGQWRQTGFGVVDADDYSLVGIYQPGLTIVKSTPSNTITVPSAPGSVGAGTNMIAYEFLVTNTGNIPLNNLVVSDPLPGLVFDPSTPTAIGTLAPNTSTVIKASYPLTAADIAAGEVRNSGRAVGNHGSTVVTPISADSNEVIVPLAPAPGLNVVKTFDASSMPSRPAPLDVVTWTVTITNTGFTDLELTGFTDSLAGATVSAPGKTTLLRGEATTVTVSYPLTQADINAGQLINQVTVESEVPGQPGITVPNTPSDGDPSTPTKEPTITPVPQVATIELVKFIDTSKLQSPPQVGDVIDYRFEVKNTGNVDLRDVVIRETLIGVTPTSFNVGDLLVGATPTAIGTASYTVTQADIDKGFVDNRAEVSGTYGPITDPKTVTDLSVTEAKVDGPSRAVLENPKVLLVKHVDTSHLSRPAVPGDLLHYTFEVTNTGNIPLDNVRITDLLPGLVLSGGPIPRLDPGLTDSTTFTATYALTTADITAQIVKNVAYAEGDWGGGSTSSIQSNNAPADAPLGYPEIAFDISVTEVVDRDGNGIIAEGDEIFYSFKVTNTGTLALSNVNLDYTSLNLSMPGLRCTPISLAVGESAVLRCTGNSYFITSADVAKGEVILSGIATGTAGDMVVNDDSQAPAVTGLAQGGLTFTKVANVDTAAVGEIVTYEIHVQNDPKGVAVTSQIVDILPAGFALRRESTRLDGAPITPQITGREIRVMPVHVAPGQTRVLSLDVLVTGSVKPGTHINRALLINPRTEREIAPEAQAVVRVLAEPVFHCATILGRVFDDRDQNGQMRASGGEPGLPSVRLLAPDGRVIETDAHGRFNVPCAALPRNVGSNFMLKLDERSLPSGYRVTTENPRVARVTPGMITRLDFGAALSRLVRIDVAEQAFAADGLRPEFAAGLAKLVRDIRQTPTHLQMTYLVTGQDDRELARRRLRETERYLRQLWRDTGHYTLDIETKIEIATKTGARQ